MLVRNNLDYKSVFLGDSNVLKAVWIILGRIRQLKTAVRQ